MKKIVYVGNKLSKKGKTVTSIETLGRLLQQEGYETILTSSKKNKLLRIIDMFWTVIKHKNDTSYILIDTYSTLNFYYALIIAFTANTLKIPYVPILRGGDLPNRIKRSKRHANYIFKKAYKNVAPSEYLNSEFLGEGYNNTVFIPNNIELKNYDFKKRVTVTPKILWVRSFRNIYNPKMAVAVLRDLKKKYPNACMCMVGPEADGSYEETKQLVNDYNLNQDVLFTGMLSKEAWREISKDYDIFMNTTNFDNTPISVIEAMALGLPVVSTNVGGIPFLISDKNDGLLSPKGDVKAMSKNIDYLINNSDKAIHISLKAREKVQNFDWEKVKTKWISMLN